MKILVCISKAPDTTSKIAFKDNNTTFDENGVQFIVNPYAHSMFDGDTVFGLATGDDDIGDLPPAMQSTASRQRNLNLVLRAAADTFASACTHAVLSATTIGTADAYLDVVPSAAPRPSARGLAGPAPSAR